MIKKTLIPIMILFTLLEARENPFQPIVTDRDIDMREAPNLPKPNYFTKEEIELPSSARVIERVIIEYKNVDGTLAKKSVDIDRDIDWHNPLILTHNPPKELKLTPKQEPKVKYLGDKKLSPVPPALDMRVEIPTEIIKSLNPYSFLKIDLYKSKALIGTKDIKIREFTLSNPPRIVVDFKRVDVPNSKNFNTLSESTYFQRVSIGRHKDYYRVVFKLDGRYKHSLTKTELGYLLELK